jgi:hypothetical protein
MRAATFVAVLALHVALVALFLTSHFPAVPKAGFEAPMVAVLLPLVETAQPTQPPKRDAPASSTKGRTGHSTSLRRVPPAAQPSETVPEAPTPQAIMIPLAPDWRQEARIVADDELESDERRRRNPSLLAPHDFSDVPHGAVDVTKPQFGWSHSATHRVETFAEGGFMLNINDRCSIAIMIIPMPFCRVGKIPVRGDLFEHMDDPSPARQSNLP